eukprot:4049944-Prymnesium_polylepis.1
MHRSAPYFMRAHAHSAVALPTRAVSRSDHDAPADRLRSPRSLRPHRTTARLVPYRSTGRGKNAREARAERRRANLSTRSILPSEARAPEPRNENCSPDGERSAMVTSGSKAEAELRLTYTPLAVPPAAA